MRKKCQQHMPLMDAGVKHPHAEDYERVLQELIQRLLNATDPADLAYYNAGARRY